MILPDGQGPGGAGVTSFNTRTGAVTPGNSDYLAVSAGGLTGATAATRFVGGTASGAPTAGTFAVGDFVIDQSAKIWVCTAAGTPGTWAQVGGSGGLPSGGSVGQLVTNIGSGTGDWEWPFPNFIRVSDQGAKGDCRFGSQCTTVANSTTVTVTDGNLTSADVGKVIVMNAAASGGSSWSTTISSVTNATTCVVASAPTAAVSSLSWAIGTDDTTAFKNAITAGQALAVARWTLLLDDLAYMIAGSFVTTNNYNTQIPLPNVSSAASRVTIEIRGKSNRPHAPLASGDSCLSAASGPLMFCGLASAPAWSGSVGLASMIGGYATQGPAGSGVFSQVCPVFRGITFASCHAPQSALTDMGGCQQAICEDCWWTTNEADSQVTPANNFRQDIACVMPLNNNNDVCELRGVNASFNHTWGFVLGEHTNADKLFAVQAVGGGVGLPSWQSNVAQYIQHLETHSCVNGISGIDLSSGASYGITQTPSTFISIGLWDSEDVNSGSWALNNNSNCGTSLGLVAYGQRTLNGSVVVGGWTSAGNPRIIDLNTSQGAFTPPSLPASGTAFARVWRDRMLVFTGGTVSSITVGGTNVNTSGGVLVPAGFLLVVNYSAAPTISANTIL